MENFPKYYTRLFNGIIDALEAIKVQDYYKAEHLLITAQQDAEEMYLEDGDGEDEDDELSGYTTVDLAPTIAEMKRLEMQMLLHESDEAFRMLMQQEKETPLKDPACEEKVEEDFGFRPGHLGTP